MAALSLIRRNLSTFRVLRTALAEPLPNDPKALHHETWRKWKSLFFLVCCPAIAVSIANWQLLEEEPRLEFKKYAHLRIRTKMYRWRDGVKTLFHNPHTNALPDGYEGH